MGAGGIESAISNIIHGGGNNQSPMTGFQPTPDMQSVIGQNPALKGLNLQGATVAGATPNAPNTQQIASMANPGAASSGGGMGPGGYGLMGAAQGGMMGGPRGAVMGGMEGTGQALTMSGHPEIGVPLMMAPMAMQAFGLGGGGGGQMQVPPPLGPKGPMPPQSVPGQQMN